MNKLFNIIKQIYSLDIYKRRLILILSDSLLLQFSLTLAYIIYPSEINTPTSFIIISLITCFSGIILFNLLGQYNALTKYVGSKSIYKLALTTIFLVLLALLINKLFFAVNLSFNFWFIYWIFLNVLINSKNLVFRDILLLLNKNHRSITKVIIFGAGSAGAQLSNNLLISGGYYIKSFIDDNKFLWGRNINGIKINSPNYLKKIDLSNYQILLAMPSIKKSKKLEVFNFLKSFNVPIKIIPSLEDITSGRAKINELRPIKLEDLLGRESKSEQINFPSTKIQDNVICVTGAGGSIGQELCRQIIKMMPKKLILFDISEASLYKIFSDLESTQDRKDFIVPILGNASNPRLVKSVFDEYQVKIVFHAAAYKHVPLVELNPLEGIYNNVFSTKVICDCAANSNIDNVVLISSDKAVRPSNVMGCSKRLSELIIQAYAEINNKTIFSMVRFGNVLFSSGSVVPLFLNQIKKGGPITITHSEMTRYFMSIPEAVQLVMKTIDMSEGGDVFLLDMGNPVKILHLAEQMIKLSGLKVKSENNSDGDIEIIETGLRPGEKLYEELLIDSKSIPTTNPQIYKAKEKYIPFLELNEKLLSLKNFLEKNQTDEVFKLISLLVPEWKSSIIKK